MLADETLAAVRSPPRSGVGPHLEGANSQTPQQDLADYHFTKIWKSQIPQTVIAVIPFRGDQLLSRP